MENGRTSVSARNQKLVEHSLGNYGGSRAYHFALRGVDTFTFSKLRLAAPITETIVCCDHGRDHESMLTNGTRRVVSVEKEHGAHMDWSTDDLDKLTSLNGYWDVRSEIDRTASRVTPTLIIPFKNTPTIDGLRSNKVKVLSPYCDRVHHLDSKLNLPGILKEAGIDVIPGEIVQKRGFSEDVYSGLVQRYGQKLVSQIAFGSGGSGTFFTNTKEEIDTVFKRPGADELKIARFIKGPTFNGQAVVLDTTEGTKTSVFNPSFQIIGLPEITDWPSYYCGNDFTGALEYLGEDGKKQYVEMLTKLGNVMGRMGWKGVFGVDLIWDEAASKLYILEINPRMQASTSFLNMLQEGQGMMGIGTYHLLAFLSDRPLPADFAGPHFTPLRGSHVLVNNKTGDDVMIAGDLQPGIYNFNGGLHLSEPHHWKAIRDGEYLITCGVPKRETVVENHATMLKVYSLEQALNATRDGLTAHMRRVTESIYQTLRAE